MGKQSCSLIHVLIWYTALLSVAVISKYHQDLVTDA